MKKVYAMALACVMIFFNLGITAFSASVDINIVHTGDMTDTIFENGQEGTVGYGNVLSVKRNTENSILIDSGNFLTNKSKGNEAINKKIIYAMNKAGYDYATLGASDLEYSKAELDSLLDSADFEIVSSNIKYNSSYAYEYTKTETVDGIKTGFFAVTDCNSTADFIVEDALESATEAVDSLKKAGAKVIVGIVNTKDSELARQIVVKNPSVTILVESGTGTFYEGGKAMGSTLVVNTGVSGKAIGVSAATLENSKLKSFQTTNYTLDNILEVFPETNSLETEMQAIYEELNRINTSVLGTLPKELVYDKQAMGTASTELGNFVADAIRSETGADFAIVSANEFKNGLPIEVTGEAVNNLFMENRIIEARKISKESLIKAFEKSVNEAGESASDDFLQISGFKIIYNPDYEQGKRILDIVFADGSEMEASKEYTVAALSGFFSRYSKYFVANKTNVSTITASEMVKNYVVKNAVFDIDDSQRVEKTDERRSTTGVIWIILRVIVIFAVIVFVVIKMILTMCKK